MTVIAPNQSVIGTGDLHSVRSSAQTILGCVEGTEVFRFRVTGLPGEPRYGVQIATVPGTIWIAPAEDAQVVISGNGEEIDLRIEALLGELPHTSLSLS